MHNKAEIIHQAKRWANRRIAIIKHNWSSGTWKPDHFFSKNKVHCSCPTCSGFSKTNSKVVKNNWKHSDKKKRLKSIDFE